MPLIKAEPTAHRRRVIPYADAAFASTAAHLVFVVAHALSLAAPVRRPVLR
jgi:hypothetical protein